MSTDLNRQRASVSPQGLAEGEASSSRRRSGHASAPTAAARARFAHEAQAVR